MQPWFNISLFQKMWAGNNLNKLISVCLSSLANGFCFQGSLFSCIKQIHFVHFFFHCVCCSVFQSRDVSVANCFWLQSHLGIGLYLYGSSHLREAPLNRRILYSVFGSFLFNFGSVLFWATCKSLLPDRSGLRALFGLASGFVLLYVGREYVDYVDCQKKK